MAAVAGLRGTGDWATDERPKNFREFILFRNPNGTTPITALMARIAKETTDDPEFNWWDEPDDITRLLVNGALGAGDTTVVVDSSDPSTSDPDARWGVATHLAAGDILMVEPAADAAVFTVEYIVVTGVQSETQFTVKRGQLGSTAGAISDNANLLRIGSVFSEGSQSPAAVSRNPIKYTNFCQIFKTAYELTETSRVTKTRTGDPLKNDKRRRMADHAKALEFSTMFGRKSETTGDNGKPQRTMDGIRRFIPTKTTTVFGAAVTISSFLDAVYPVFDFDTPAGDQRICFLGNAALNELNKVIQTDSNTQIQYGGTIRQFGMSLTEWRLPQGTLFLRTHPLLNRHPLYDNSMWILDFAAMRWRHMPGRDTKFMDNIQQNDEDTKKGQWLTEGGLEVRFGGLTMGYLGNISAT